jgi:hypothetical protein
MLHWLITYSIHCLSNLFICMAVVFIIMYVIIRLIFAKTHIALYKLLCLLNNLLTKYSYGITTKID